MNKYFMPAGFLITIISLSILIVNSNNRDDLKNDLALVQQDVKEIKEILRNVRNAGNRPPNQVAQRPENATIVNVSIKGDPYLGNKKSKLVLVEFSEFQCPYCAKYFMTTFNRLKAEYIDTGKVGYVFKDFPLDFHLQAQKASEAAHCAYDQGKYWEMHDKLFRNQNKLLVPDLKNYAKELRLNSDEFNSCLDSGKHAKLVRDNFNQGQVIGVRGTPSFILGKLTPSGTVEGVLMRGAIPFNAFTAAIESELRQ